MEQVRRAIGGGLENAMRRFVREADLPRALQLYRAYWDRTMLDGVELMPGAGELLRALHARGCTLAVLTNKHRTSSRRCAITSASRRCSAAFSARSDTPWLKPDPRLTAHVLAALGADAATTCLVGDSPFDAEAARRGGIAGIFVATGTQSAAELRAAGASRIYPDLSALARDAFGLEPDSNAPSSRSSQGEDVQPPWSARI